jgi:hypothetical protein
MGGKVVVNTQFCKATLAVHYKVEGFLVKVIRLVLFLTGKTL